MYGKNPGILLVGPVAVALRCFSFSLQLSSSIVKLNLAGQSNFSSWFPFKRSAYITIPPILLRSKQGHFVPVNM